MYGLTAVRSTHVIAWVAAAISVSVAGIGWLHTTQGRRLVTELGDGAFSQESNIFAVGEICSGELSWCWW
ncbi:hypothetical protein [Burkholderia pseudomultivorans]|uniref:hypothetical protein n=1 Tax=Burkholderia pseudomultivorans TaxID=1207504 RepID=UPI0002F30E6C|nr:hypothetical protein [Burkholderia pseudomultivorans]AOI90084.1 hypothetical protein WS57_14380 [Burkholderia pseudomultivorans]KVC24567.1 hypothetical protein WS55_17955 [Burkholderia pseudomultivorans]KVC25506.1 hypothetical protein WS56_28305 [Burkholderia pseudomultivorans]